MYVFKETYHYHIQILLAPFMPSIQHSSLILWGTLPDAVFKAIVIPFPLHHNPWPGTPFLGPPSNQVFFKDLQTVRFFASFHGQQNSLIPLGVWKWCFPSWKSPTQQATHLVRRGGERVRDLAQRLEVSTQQARLMWPGGSGENHGLEVETCSDDDEWWLGA